MASAAVIEAAADGRQAVLEPFRKSAALSLGVELELQLVNTNDYDLAPYSDEYHGVTLGGTSWNKGKRHPTLEQGVVIGAGQARPRCR